MKFAKKKLLCVLLLIALLIFSTNSIVFGEDEPDEEKVDDWVYTGATALPTITSAPKTSATNYSYAPLPSAAPSVLGFATGGAKDINNFRENIENNYFPKYSSLTYEGLFYDYFFDTGKQQETNKLFSPSYSYSISKDPLSKQSEYYLSVGLNSGMKEEDFQRKKLNLTIVLDISGSMSASLDNYYYDNPIGTSTENKNKLDVACESIVGLLNHLNDDDRFGMVLFDGNAYLGKPMSLVGKTNMAAIKKHILELTPQGSTNFAAGYKLGTQLFEKYKDSSPDEYENRIIFLTDAMPNVGNIDENSLLGMTQNNARNNIYSSFIGIGVDFNTTLIEYITKIRGANYYSVHSSKEFKTRMDDEFEYMVTPLVFNLQLNLESKGFQIEKVYGSPEANESTGEILKVNTLFPSKVTNDETKGGLILLKLKKISNDNNMTLSTSYEDRNGKTGQDTITFAFGNEKPDFYQNTGIRKGILLTRYANIIKNWLVNEAEINSSDIDDTIPPITSTTGIMVPDDQKCIQLLSKWEQKSVPLNVSPEYKNLFNEFIPYFKNEVDSIGDDTLLKELDLLKKLSTYNNN